MLPELDVGVERLHRVGHPTLGLTHHRAHEEGLAGALDAGVADLAAGERKEEALEQEVDALEILSELEGACGAETVLSVHECA